MPRIKPFEKHTTQYENWFERHAPVYQSELMAMEAMLPETGKGIEIGIGSGRFALPLDIQLGVEPSWQMARLATRKGAKVIIGVGEALPVANNTFDFVTLVTTICFLDNIETALRECYRILRIKGNIIIGFVDKDSLLGRKYQQNKAANVFYREATFYSVDEVLDGLVHTGFNDFAFRQTIFRRLDQIDKIEEIALVGIVGEGLSESEESVKKVIASLSENNLHAELIVTGASKIASYFIIKQHQLAQAVRTVHASIFQS